MRYDCRRKCEINIYLCSNFTKDKETKAFKMTPQNDNDLNFSLNKTLYSRSISETNARNKEFQT